MPGGWPLAAMAIALVVVSAIVAAVTPAALIVPPERPYVPTGSAAVRTESAAYPRSATGADAVRTTVASAPRRIVSQYWSIDEFLYAVVPPERVVGVSESAYLKDVSNVLDLVNRFRPVVATDPERVLRANPDLVFAAETARADAPGILREAGLPVYRMFTTFETLQSIADHIRLVGYLTGEDARAAAEIQRFEETVARAAARRPAGMPSPRVVGLSGMHTYGSRTVFHDILRALGAENLAATHGLTSYDRLSDEQIIRWDPDWIVTNAHAGMEESVRAALAARPAIAGTSAARHGRIVVVTTDAFLPLSPFTTRLVEALATALYGASRP
jgi:iron complex transport system substrate-binding protein